MSSASVSQYPAAEVMNRGVPPTEEKALTGEFTPPGMTAHASAKSAAEAATDDGVRCMTTSVPARAEAVNYRV